MNQTGNKEKIEINAEDRQKMGKATRIMRKEGLLPAVIYGKNFTPVSISVNSQEFGKLFKQAGETTVVYVNVSGKSYPTLISDIQYHPVTDNMIHVDFRKVNLKQKIEAQVPLEFIGESDLVKSKEGMLLVQVEEITVYALPTEIPHKIEVDTSTLNEFGDTIKVSDLPKSENYEITEDPEVVLVSLSEHEEEEILPETTLEQPEIITEKPADGGDAESQASEGKSE